MTQEADWLELFTKPLSENEMAQYQEVVDSHQFKILVRAYHSQAALSAASKLILKLFEQQLAPEVVLYALVAAWLDNTCRINKDVFDDNFREAWLKIPQILCQVLLQQGVDLFNQHRDHLNADYPPELEEYYQKWLALRPPGQSPEKQQTEAFMEQVREVCGRLLYFQNYLHQDCKLKMEIIDFQDMWTHILLQNYIFTYFEQVDLYFLLATNWEYMAQKMPDFLDLLAVIKGFEEMLLPENHDQLMALLSNSQLSSLN